MSAVRGSAPARGRRGGMLAAQLTGAAITLAMGVLCFGLLGGPVPNFVLT